MNIAVWGAGNVGTHLIRRLAVTPYTSRIVWLNRNLDRIEKASIDIAHGLAFAPACREVRAYSVEQTAEALVDTDILVLTLGKRVQKDQTRADVYLQNAEIFRESVVTALKGSFVGGGTCHYESGGSHGASAVARGWTCRIEGVRVGYGCGNGAAPGEYRVVSVSITTRARSVGIRCGYA